MTEILPPNPDVSGWHLLLDEDGQEISWHWQAEGKRWDALSPANAAHLGYRYICPIPTADQLAAMREIVNAAGSYLANYEAETDATLPDDYVFGFFGRVTITAGMIRRAA